jgi:two-component system OmpR family response regulator
LKHSKTEIKYHNKVKGEVSIRMATLLLEYLLRHPRQVLSRNQIIENVWSYDFVGESNVIEVYIRALRLKLEVNQSPRLIQTIRGIGYALKKPI